MTSDFVGTVRLFEREKKIRLFSVQKRVKQRNVNQKKNQIRFAYLLRRVELSLKRGTNAHDFIVTVFTTFELFLCAKLFEWSVGLIQLLLRLNIPSVFDNFCNTKQLKICTAAVRLDLLHSISRIHRTKLCTFFCKWIGASI